jgi:hypothetical protein
VPISSCLGIAAKAGTYCWFVHGQADLAERPHTECLSHEIVTDALRRGRNGERVAKLGRHRGRLDVFSRAQQL